MTTEHFEPTHANRFADVEPEFNAEDREYTLAIPGSMQEIEREQSTEPIIITVLVPEQLAAQSEIDVVLHLHGQYHSTAEEHSFIDTIRKAGKLIASVTTSRRSTTATEPDLMTALRDPSAYFAQLRTAQETAFAGKTYVDERADFSNGFQVALHTIIEQLRNDRPMHISMLGISLGARIAAELSTSIQPERLVLYAPPLDVHDEYRSTTFAAKHATSPAQVLNTMSKDGVTVIRGSKDIAVSAEECAEYINATHAGTYVEIPNMPHEFFFSENQEQQVVQAVLSALST